MTNKDEDRLEPQDIENIFKEETSLTFQKFSIDDAWNLGCLLRSEAISRGHSIAIEISLGEQRVFHTSLRGTSAHNNKWIERKKATAREWGCSSYLVGLRFPIFDPPYSLETAPWMDVKRYSGSGGSVPILISDTGIVGTVTVSGLRHDIDHAFVVEGLKKYREIQGEINNGKRANCQSHDE